MRLSAGSSAASILNVNTDVPAYIPISQLLANGDFTYASLAGCVNSVPFTPNYLGALGAFYYSSELSPDIKIDFDGQTIGLIQSTAPNAPGIASGLVREKLVSFTAPRLSKTLTIMASELSRYRQFANVGIGDYQTRADRELRQIIRNFEATFENHRLTSLQGVLLDADGSTLLNIFTALGIAQPTFDLLLGTTTTGFVQGKLVDLLNKIEDALQNFAPTGIEPIIIYGRTLWKEFITHPNVYTAYQYFEAQAQKDNPQRDDLRYKDFKFGGFRHRQYRGSYTSGTTTSYGSGTLTQMMSANNAYIVYPDVDGMYLGLVTPPRDILQYVDEPGQMFYMTQKELDHNAGIELRVQSNVLHLMTRPAASFQITSST